MGEYTYEYKICQARDCFHDTIVCENILIFTNERYVAREYYPITEKSFVKFVKNRFSKRYHLCGLHIGSRRPHLKFKHGQWIFQNKHVLTI